MTRTKTALALICLCICGIAPVLAEDSDWSVNTSIDTFYTDDVALFSVSRRLSLKDDPTQPIVDRPGQGGDFVYEPGVELDWRKQNRFGEFDISLDAGAYLFTQRTDFTHGLFEVLVSQSFSTGTKISVLYNVAPDLFLGQNAFREVGREESEFPEKLTNHYGSIHIDQALSETLTVRLLGRYGARVYDTPFGHRDTEFWTLGPHLEWQITPDVDLLIGYHYERGNAAHHKALHFPDNVSYVNHYASAELSIRLMEKLNADFIFDYEKNDFTTANHRDEHFGSAEVVYQGEIELRYELTKRAGVKLGWQHGSRRLSIEPAAIKNNNVWLGMEYLF